VKSEIEKIEKCEGKEEKTRNDLKSPGSESPMIRGLKMPYENWLKPPYLRDGRLEDSRLLVVPDDSLVEVQPTVLQLCMLLARRRGGNQQIHIAVNLFQKYSSSLC
jgi:hypothetical protein